MGLKIRLARAGAKKRPYYHIVVADSRSPRDGRFVEKVGSYNPMLPSEHTDRVRLFDERLKHWLGQGALPTERVAKFLGRRVQPQPFGRPVRDVDERRPVRQLRVLPECRRGVVSQVGRDVHIRGLHERRVKVAVACAGAQRDRGDGVFEIS